MPRKSAKVRGGKKDFAQKNTLNPPTGGNQSPGGTRQPEEQDPERQIGQFGDKGNPPIMKR